MEGMKCLFAQSGVTSYILWKSQADNARYKTDRGF